MGDAPAEPALRRSSRRPPPDPTPASATSMPPPQSPGVQVQQAPSLPQPACASPHSVAGASGSPVACTPVSAACTGAASPASGSSLGSLGEGGAPSSGGTSPSPGPMSESSSSSSDEDVDPELFLVDAFGRCPHCHRPIPASGAANACCDASPTPWVSLRSLHPQRLERDSTGSWSSRSSNSDDGSESSIVPHRRFNGYTRQKSGNTQGQHQGRTLVPAHYGVAGNVASNSAQSSGSGGRGSRSRNVDTRNVGLGGQGGP